MLSFVGSNTHAPVRSLSKQKFQICQHILKTLTSIFNVNANSTHQSIQLSFAKSFNPLLQININLQPVILKLPVCLHFCNVNHVVRSREYLYDSTEQQICT